MTIEIKKKPQMQLLDFTHYSSIKHEQRRARYKSNRAKELNTRRLKALSYYKETYEAFEKGLVCQPVGVSETDYQLIFDKEIPSRIKTLSQRLTGISYDDSNALCAIRDFFFSTVRGHKAMERSDLTYMEYGSYDEYAIKHTYAAKRNGRKERLAKLAGGGVINFSDRNLYLRRPASAFINEYCKGPFEFMKHLQRCKEGEVMLKTLKSHYRRIYNILLSGKVPKLKGINPDGSVYQNINIIVEEKFPRLNKLKGNDYKEIENHLDFLGIGTQEHSSNVIQLGSQ